MLSAWFIERGDYWIVPIMFAPAYLMHWIYKVYVGRLEAFDVFFQSVSLHWRGEAVGIVLTGMGRDGALGLKALRNRGHYTIAQDEASSAVYGMPKAAATLDAAVDILPIDGIAPRLVDLLACKR